MLKRTGKEFQWKQAMSPTFIFLYKTDVFEKNLHLKSTFRRERTATAGK